MLEKFLRKYFSYKEIGWTEIGEKFTRFKLLSNRFFNLYLHKLDAKIKHEKCHDHPWHFWAIVLSGGYHEYTKKGVVWRGPGSILYRPATFSHNVTTTGVNWSLVLTSHRLRSWQFLDCE